MSSKDSMCVILLDGAGVALREKIHDSVKENANGWWHRFQNCWLAAGHSPKYWRDLLKPYVAEAPESAAILVLALPPLDDDRLWAYFGPDAEGKMGWLHRNYTD